eukprot:Rhum_TRINITY_DN21234_c0_g1::Rhum_TRINITY_DN21234_c0_g1_i1::g.173537::m.173537/K00428/E1.11.1.5; cytochrome c peroxidase
MRTLRCASGVLGTHATGRNKTLLLRALTLQRRCLGWSDGSKDKQVFKEGQERVPEGTNLRRLKEEVRNAGATPEQSEKSGEKEAALQKKKRERRHAGVKKTKHLTGKDHKERNTFMQILLIIFLAGGMTMWYLTSLVTGGDLALSPFDPLYARELLEELFQRNPDYPAAVLKLLWNANSNFRYTAKKDLERHACTGAVDVTAAPFAGSAQLIEDLAAVVVKLEEDSVTTTDPSVQRNAVVSTNDLWAFACCIAVQSLGGPQVPFKFGRKDYKDRTEPEDVSIINPRVADSDTFRRRFYQAAFTDRELVALMGAHGAARTHQKASGFPDGLRLFDGTKPPTIGSAYYKNLLEVDWVKSKCGGYYYNKKDKKHVCLAADHMLVENEQFRYWCKRFARDELFFREEFSTAMAKLLTEAHAPWGPVVY